MKIFLANPACRISIGNEKERYFVRAGSRWPFSTFKKINDKPDYVPFPFFLAYTAALLENNGHQVVVDDGVAINETEAELLNKVKNENPDILLFEATTPTIGYDLKLVKKIKQLLPKTIICLAGAHTTVYPREILEQNPNVDFLFLAEYEVNFTNFFECFSRGTNIYHIDGLAYRKSGKIFINKGEAIDLDRLPFPARHFFPNNKNPNLNLYWDGFCQYKHSVQMHASRGCPFRCDFCLWNQVIYKNGKYRYFSAERIVDEMEEVVKKYGAKEIYFDDDTFTANKKQVLEICRQIKKRNFKIYWSVMGDAMVSDEEMVQEMAEAGCIGIKFGVESGNKEILKRIGKPIDFTKVKKFAEWCSRNKIKTHATFTFGLSGETKKTMQETLDFAKELDVDSVQFSITTPFPGTRYFEQLEKEERLTSKQWKDFDGSSSSTIKFKDFSEKELVRFYQQASGRWLLAKLKDPAWLKRQIYNLKRQADGQNYSFLLKKFKRFMELIINAFK